MKDLHLTLPSQDEEYHGGFTGNSEVQIWNSENTKVLVPIRSLNTGMELVTNNGRGRIRKIIKTIYESKILYKVGHFYLTPYHPCMTDHGFFPIHKSCIKLTCNSEQYVYNLIMEDRGLITDGYFYFSTLGHNCKNGIYRHPYLTSQKLIDDYDKFFPGTFVRIDFDPYQKDNDKIVGLYIRPEYLI